MSFGVVGRARLVSDRGLTLGNLADRLADAHGGRRMVTPDDGSEPLTFARAPALVDVWAGAIAARCEPGDRVVVATRNRYDQLLAALAACRAGAVAVPVNPAMKPEEVEHVVADAGATVVVHDTAELAGGSSLGRAWPTKPDSIAALFYTSGTTGTPKGVELTHRGLLGAFPLTALLPTMLRRDEAVLAQPLAHIMGFVGALGFACAGVPVVFFERFHADAVIATIERRRCTIVVGVPAMYRLLLEAGAEQHDLKSVRVWLSGADVLPDDVADRLARLGAAATLPGVGSVGRATVVEGYGMAELAGAVAGKLRLPLGTKLPVLSHLVPSDAVGVPLPGWRLRVVRDDGTEARHGEVGDLHVKGPGAAAGYWGDAAATAELLTDDGWVRTGDLASKGALGTIRFAGRSKDVIKRGGYSVYALEVEATLARHPAVAEAAVLGLPDPRLGEVPVAAVRPRMGVVVSAEELLAFCREHLASYKCPVEVAFVDELPRTGSHKVRKADLRPLFTPRP